MVQPQRGFGIRLGQAIDRWPGGGQRSFAKALAEHARSHGITIATSYRTLLNYLSEATAPSAAWIDAAATILRYRADFLLTGVGPEREGADQPPGLTFSVSGDAAHRTSALVHLILNGYHELPMAARQMMFAFVSDHYGDDFDGWENWTVDPGRKSDVAGVIREHFRPLISGPRLDYVSTCALAASLTAAAYLTLAPAGPEYAEP